MPFAVFMAFIGLTEIAAILAQHAGLALSGPGLLFLYPLRVAAAGVLLWVFRSHYSEITFSDLRRYGQTLVSLLSGAAVFVAWISLDLSYSFTSALAPGYDPNLLPEGGVRFALICIRIVGAVLVVPIMEELFWRSFLTRYLLRGSFLDVEPGTFTLFSFLTSAICFGLEHNLILAGILAGIVYNGILWYTKSISQCIIAHAFTNFLLAWHVLATGKWNLW